eukprot:symbB.v1.2.000031.t1/scaffold12.1/size699752/11
MLGEVWTSDSSDTSQFSIGRLRCYVAVFMPGLCHWCEALVAGMWRALEADRRMNGVTWRSNINGAAWIGMVMQTSQEVACVELFQSAEEPFSSATIYLERWGGSSWILAQTFTRVGVGETVLLNQARQHQLMSEYIDSLFLRLTVKNSTLICLLKQSHSEGNIYKASTRCVSYFTCVFFRNSGILLEKIPSSFLNWRSLKRCFFTFCEQMEPERPLWIIYFLLFLRLGFLIFLMYRLGSEDRRYKEERIKQSQVCSELSEMLRGKCSID